MGHAPLRSWILGCALLLAPAGAHAQMIVRPAERPLVTAENDRWFREGQPLTFAGSFYYPAGPTVFFNGNEMVRTGEYLGIPLFVLNTREPYAVVFVPTGQGLMQPYERRRAGDIAGTVGSTAPSFPVERDIELRSWSGVRQSAAPPMVEDLFAETSFMNERVARMAPAGPATEPVRSQPPLGSLRSALIPLGLNAFFIHYNGQRWFSSGRAVLMDPAAFSRAADYQGFPAYVRKGSPRDTIYIAVVDGALSLLTPYSNHK